MHAMTNKLKIWEEKELSWDQSAAKECLARPIRSLKQLPQMPGITTDTARFLKIKALYYLIKQDTKKIFARYFFKRPIKYSLALIKSYCKKESYIREEDFFFYGIQNEEEFKNLLLRQDTLFLMGFSYCHKPFECPSGRFSAECIHDTNHSVCQQCFIGKAANLSPKEHCTLLFIPTIHYIGEKVFEAVHAHPDKQVVFLITACEMTLKMFSDWGNMVGAKGIGVRLDGRICNTMQAFTLSEEGVKPGLTVLLDPTKKKILDLLKFVHMEKAY